jgi:hypothetical protein
MPNLTIVDVARLADAAYDVNASAGADFSRTYYGDLSSGFKGSYFSFANGSGLDVICAFAGTETDTADDVLADVGFGAGLGPAFGALGPVAGALGQALADAGARQLTDQLRGALEMCRQAMWYATSSRSRLVVTGHSLGGGLASMVACRLGLRAVTFNCPATSQLGYVQGNASIFNIADANDPINQTLRLGRRIGPTLVMRTGFSGGSAHLMGNTITSLSAGTYAPTGLQSAFTAGG